MPTLTVTFTNPATPPKNGYEVDFRKKGTTTWNRKSPNPTLSPFNIAVPQVASYEVRMRSDCGNGVYSEWRYAEFLSSNSFTSQFAATESVVCSAGLDEFWVVDPATHVATGVAVFFDEARTQSIGNGFILDAGGQIFEVVNGVVGNPTGNSC